MIFWDEALDDFARYLEESDRSEATIDGYLKHMRWLSEGVEADPWELTAEQLREWLDGQRWSAQTRRKVLVSFRMFYAWATSLGLCRWAPTAGLPSAEPRKRGPLRKPIAPAWESAVDGFLLWCRAQAHSEGTLDVRRWHLCRLAEVSADPWSVTTQQLAVFLSNPDWAPEMKRSLRGSVRSFYRWAEIVGHVEISPALRLDTVRLSRALPRPAPEDVLEAALSRADDRQRLAIMLAAYAGLRRAEIAGLHTSNIGETDLLIVGKGGHQRRVPLHPLLRSEIVAELNRRRRGVHGSGFGSTAEVDGWLFPSTSGSHLTPHYLGTLVSPLLGEGYATHTLRHRFATRAYASQRDLRAVQELLGHTKPETTARYAAVPDGALHAAVMGVGGPRV